MEVTTTTTKSGKFDARFYHLIHEEEIGRLKGHFGPINSLAFHPDGKRYYNKDLNFPQVLQHCSCSYVPIFP